MPVGSHLRVGLERDACERLAEDDQATQREAEFLDVALLNQRLRAAGEPVTIPGVCTNCDERCHPLAVYCDPDCRADHQARLARARRG
jgi:hypothetical protein